MSLLPPVGWADVATKQDLAYLRADFDHLRREVATEIGSLRKELHAEIGMLRIEFRADMEVGFASLRSELHQSVRNQTWALVAWTTALAGILVALGR